MSQSQAGGMGSKNVQIHTINVGMTYSDVRDIATDVFERNAERLAQAAEKIVQSRVNELRDCIDEKLKSKTDAELEGFSHPEKQVALLDAQKAYALSGDEDLKGMLTQAIVSLSSEPERSLKGIVLQEAIKVMPSLTKRQIMLLSVAFLTKYVLANQIRSISDLVSFYEDRVGSGFIDQEFTDGDFRHIEFTRCGSVDIGELPLRDVFVAYKGLFSKGFDFARTEVLSWIPQDSIMPCLNNGKLFQVAALNDQVFEQKASNNGWNAEQRIKLKEMYNENIMTEEEMKKAVSAISPFGKKLVSDWQKTPLKSLKLSSVGIAIAYSYAVQNAGIDADIDIWV